MIKDLTEGEPRKVLWQFTLPMFVSVIFQQLYNIADSVIVGNFSAHGEDALAAVGASYPITMIFMAIAMGCNVGCAVIISQLFGAKRYKEMKTAVSTTLLASLVLSLALTVLGLLFSRAMMRAINTPDNIFGDADVYLKIYIGGFVFLFLYNVVTGVFTSLGDSKTPLYFLIGSSLSNIVLDWVFVAVFHWDVAGVAWATFICQGAACVLAMVTLQKRLKAMKCEGKPELFSKSMLQKIAVFAIPSVLQQSFVSVGNIFIQSLINGYGSSVIAGYSAAIKINTFGITCFGTMGNAMSSFTAQNIGAGLTERVKKGLKAGLSMGLLVGVPFFAACFFAGSGLIRLFMSEESALALSTGVEFLKIVAPFYFVISLKLITDGLLRGSGALKWFMISTFSDLILRVALGYILSVPFGTTGIWLSWPIGWSMGTVLSLLFYAKGVWKPKKEYT
ncbi:MAG: MATE family efflux transporter [Lachnospiraceae bacterium]|nr:MATE family efflux transporter [Lachnospiraceae bacterium]